MTRINTMGTRSCACIAISGWKEADLELEREYEKGVTPKPGNDVVKFYDKVLYPVEQGHGNSGEYAFSHLMDSIDDYHLGTKFIILTIAEHQLEDWKDLVKSRGFELIDITDNIIGGLNYIFTRNNNRVEIEDEDC